MAYNQPLTFTSDPNWFLPTEDYETIRGLAGVDIADWPNERIQQVPFLPTALSDALMRLPTEDWETETIGDANRQWLRLGLQYYTAALMVPVGQTSKTEDFKIGSFSLKTDETVLLANANDLYGYANSYYANLVLPDGIVSIHPADSFDRAIIRRASVINVGPGRLY